VPELREDPLTGSLVVLAPGRAARPDATTGATGATGERAASGGCPFCPGHEHETPPEVLRTGGGAAETPGWRVRVVPNLYPIVGGDIDGAHEVIVLSPEHDHSFGHLPDDVAAEVFGVMRDRCAHHIAAGFPHVQPFINHGRGAGASLGHPHAQLVALPFVPPEVAFSLSRFRVAGEDLVALEMDDALEGVHGVLHGAASAWCPPAARSPYEVLVAHPDSGAGFDRAPDDEVAAVAEATRRVLWALHEVLGDVPYNVVVHTAPGGVQHDYHWYVRVRPRVTIPAGFEDGSGLFVNTVDPAAAAAALRAAIA
jgi:UDPglucose--hexose-1-phosphate uridylyltransferase